MNLIKSFKYNKNHNRNSYSTPDLKANSSLPGCLFEHKTGSWKVITKDATNTFTKILVVSHIIIRLRIVSISFQIKTRTA